MIIPASGDRSSILTASIDTPGISRNMSADDVPLMTTGGGNLNGSANMANLLGQAGTASQRINVPRAAIKTGGGNYCGVV
jgi:hypothetical protein